MSENLQISNTGTDLEREEGKITYATEVISTIVTVATTEVEGISGISGATSSLTGIIGKGKTPRGVKVDMKGETVCVDISVTVDYGMPIQKVGRNCQENVRKSIESMTGLHVEKVDLHVIGVSFEKENQEMQQSQKLALTLESEEEMQAAKEEPVAVEYSEESSVEPETENEEEKEAQEETPETEKNEAETDNE